MRAVRPGVALTGGAAPPLTPEHVVLTRGLRGPGAALAKDADPEPALSSHPARPAAVCNHQVRPGASRSAGLAEPQPRCVLRR